MNNRWQRLWRGCGLVTLLALILGITPGITPGFISQFFMLNEASAQSIDLKGRPVATLEIVGLKKVSEQLVRNQIRQATGDPYDPQVVAQDVVRLTHLGRFKTVQTQVQQLPNGSLVIKYIFDEQPLISDVRVVGNKTLNDQELLALVVLRTGDPVDAFLIDRALSQIKRAYEEKGFFMTEVVLDRQLLEESGVLLFHVREGPKIRIRQMKFEGNQVFSDKEIRSQVRSKTYFLLLRNGELSRNALDDDADRIRQYYRNRGYLDAQADRTIEASPNQRDANVTFVISEGLQYTVSSVRVEGNELYGEAQIIEAMALRQGDVFSTNFLKKSNQNIIDLYGKQGFIETTVQIQRLFHDNEPKVDVVVRIKEGSPYLVGKVAVRGNQITKDNVILRQTRGMRPGRRFDRTGLETTRKRLSGSALFSDAKISILGETVDETRDVLIEVKEQNTGSISFGAGISSDAGILGAIELRQRNFDIGDMPESFSEFITGKALRGAGQSFSLVLQPGDEVSNYSINFAEPYLFDSQYSFDSSLFFFNRNRNDFDEERVGANVGFGQRFGDVWAGRIGFRGEKVDVSNIQPTAPADFTSVIGQSLLTSVTGSLSRSTVDSRMFPTQGSRFSVGLSRVGALGGDYQFTKASVEFKKFWSVDEDFLGRKTVLSFRSKMGYILEDNEAPIFERFFAGGHRTFRGFDFRGVGPFGTNANGTETDESIGGDWLFLMGLEYSVPIYQDIIRMVFFSDTGTIEESFGISDYRVTVGTGLRLKIPFLGQAPFAFDLAVPVMKQSNDSTQVFSFDIALPF